ncbi:MAG: nuclear transport factor 2 family protein, partial [Leptospirales bacterium]
MFQETANELQKVVKDYFEGIFTGDVERLCGTFHPDASLCGDINGEPYQKTVAEYLEGVRNRESPQSLGESFRMRILSMDILGNVASLRVHVPMLGFNYHDYLSFRYAGGRWTIVNKLFTNV